MGVFARYPKPDLDYQEFLHSQIKFAKCTIGKFELVNKIFKNFSIYENTSYHECNNIIFKACLRRYYSSELDLRKIDLLEKAVRYRCNLGFPRKYSEKFKRSITSCTYSESRSAFQEITIMYKIGIAMGMDNITLESSLPSSGKSTDICVFLDKGRKIYLEITSIATSKTDEKLQMIFYTAAKQLYSKIPTNYYRVSMLVDTMKLVYDDEEHVDDNRSIAMIRRSIDGISLDHIERLPTLLKTEDGQELARISLSRNDDKSSVLVHENEIHYSPPTRADPAVYRQKSASLEKIERTIKDKVCKQQYESGHPVIFVIYWMPQTIEYENNENDFCEVKNRISNYLRSYPQLSGVFLFYSDDHSNRKFIHNPSAHENVRVSTSEVDRLFYTTQATLE